MMGDGGRGGKSFLWGTTFTCLKLYCYTGFLSAFQLAQGIYRDNGPLEANLKVSLC